MKGQFMTDRGQIRDHNEDCGGIFHNPYGQMMAIIADGMGGHNAGDVASRMATTLMQQKWEEQAKLESPEDAEEWLATVISEINASLFKHAEENEACKGMGTTAVIAVCTDDFTTIGHVGDSRCYISNANGFAQLTKDHSLVNMLVQTGQISKEDAHLHPRKNVVLKALGTEEEVESDIQTLQWERGDQLLLCTDGLTDKLSDEELAAFMEKQEEMETKGQQMIDLANERGGEDNISLIIVDFETSHKEGDSPC